MKYAIISDLHANLEALKAVMLAIDNDGVDKVACLGDLVGYYADPNACLKLVREQEISCVAGNHDRIAAGLKEPVDCWDLARESLYWTRGQLTGEHLAFLGGLPLFKQMDQSFLMVHAALHPVPNEDRYLSNDAEVMKSFRVLIDEPSKIQLCFFGHTHLPVVYEYQNGSLNTIRQGKVGLNPAAYYLVNPGSVGQSRDADPRASFLTFDSEQRVIWFHRIPYDRRTCYKKTRKAGLVFKESLPYRIKHIKDRTLSMLGRWIRSWLGLKLKR